MAVLTIYVFVVSNEIGIDGYEAPCGSQCASGKKRVALFPREPCPIVHQVQFLQCLKCLECSENTCESSARTIMSLRHLHARMQQPPHTDTAKHTQARTNSLTHAAKHSPEPHTLTFSCTHTQPHTHAHTLTHAHTYTHNDTHACTHTHTRRQLLIVPSLQLRILHV